MGARLQGRVTQEMNDNLIKHFTGEEFIREALQDMGDLKAPGADGIPVFFNATRVERHSYCPDSEDIDNRKA